MTLPAVSVSQSPEEKFREFLSTRQKSQRFTGQQRDMVRFIFSQHDHFDADHLLGEMKNSGLKVSRATAYRTLAKLVEAGLLRRMEMAQRTVYEHDYGYPQHDHLLCGRCGKMIEFQSSGLDEIIRQTAMTNGFQVSGHSFVIKGTCVECNRARLPKRRLDMI